LLHRDFPDHPERGYSHAQSSKKQPKTPNYQSKCCSPA
jgi:hypothetical protein